MKAIHYGFLKKMIEFAVETYSWKLFLENLEFLGNFKCRRAGEPEHSR